MSTDKQRLFRLLDSSDWTPEDREWLTSYLQNTDTEELRALMAGLYERDLAAGEPLEPAISAMMRQRIAERTGLSGEGRTMSMRRYWWAAAAIVFLLGAGGWYLIGGRSRVTPPVAHSTKNKSDAAPGSNKAVLTLADGNTIVLDSAANGDLASQGATKVFKLDSGLLAYRTTGAAAGNQAEERPAFNTLTTPRGGQYQIVLPDGTKVWLNAASSLQFPTSFTGRERTVVLKGEAYFEVSRRSAQPFFVKLENDAVIEVLGTRFNVNDYKDEPAGRATLLEGKIRVRRNGHANDLKPGQQAVLDRNDAGFRINDDADLDEAVAWKNGMFVFNSVPLEAIMRQMERWYDVEVSYRGNVKGISFNGQISRYSNASKMLDMLATTGEVHFIMENKKIIVSP